MNYGWWFWLVVLAGRFLIKVHHALKLDAGSSSEFQQATITFKCLRSTLQEIVHGLQNADPSFRNAIRGQLDLSINSIAGFNTRLQDDYGEQLGVSALKGKHRGTLRKIKWAFSAAEDIAKFRIELSRQLEIVKLLIVSETNTKVSDIAVEVTANQEVLGTIKQQYPLLLSEAQKTRTSVKQPLSVIQEYCCTSTHLLHGIQDDYRGFSQSVGTGLQILQDQGKQKALDIAGLTANMSALSTEARQGCSERSTAHTKAALKQDMTLAAIQELCTLVVDLKNQQTGSISRSDTQQVNQYQLIQRYINEIGESAQDSATSPTSITDDTLRGLRQSRNSMTQRLISAIDGVNTTLVMRFGNLVTFFVNVN
ncbi:hypothetical protein MMC12_001611 [Toensbergia leucococca]|nr:hypothetical protein [Toensbergia leucococca]